MEMHSVETDLKKKFPRSDQADWEKIARQELNGGNPFEILSWRGKDDILFLPYYDSSKDADLHFANTFQLPAAQNSQNRTWYNLPVISTQNVEKANTQALDHLTHGADGIMFDLRKLFTPDLNKLMYNIQWPFCYIGFYLDDDNPDSLYSLTRFIQAESKPASIYGALFWESIPKRSNLDFYLNGNNNLKALGHVVQASSPASEISDALIAGVKLFEEFSAGAHPRNVFSSICFSLAADASFLETVSKFKALRMLWFQIARAYGQTEFRNEDLFIHARVEDVADTSYAPRENMLHATFAAMAAAIGGCNSLTIKSVKEDALFTRWSRNVPSILCEESFLDTVPDPLAGAWAIDAITHNIAARSWELFQQKWRDHAAS